MAKILYPIRESITALEKDEGEMKRVTRNLAKLKMYGIESEFCWPGMDDIDELLENCSGVFLMGGDDFDSVWFGEKLHPKAVLDSHERDEMELGILKTVFEKKIPLLGICRGMQGMAICRGGSLIQHVPDICDEDHGEGILTNCVVDSYHEIIIKKGTELFEFVGREKILVNSFHHQSINEIGEGLVVSGISPKGIIEVIESSDPDYFCFGIQSHPERLGNSELEIIFQKFAEAVSGKETIESQPETAKT